MESKGTVNKYESFEAAIEAVKDARDFQTKAWPNTIKENAGGRPFEEWLVLADHYVTKLKAVYTETPGLKLNLETGEYEYNEEGAKRIKKYAAIVANLYMWAVQSALLSAKEENAKL